jgi:hypothetical protein
MWIWIPGTPGELMLKSKLMPSEAEQNGGNSRQDSLALIAHGFFGKRFCVQAPGNAAAGGGAASHSPNFRHPAKDV